MKTATSMPSVDNKSFIDIYFEDIIKIPLLTREEEIFYSKQIRCYEIKRQVFKDKIQSELLVEDGDKKLNLLTNRLELSKTHMIQSNYRLVVSIAKRYRNQYMQLSDLIEEGNIGLMRAVDRFDHRLGFRFSTFAIRWIKQNVTKAIIDKGKIIRIPVHIDKLITKYKKVVARYQRLHGTSPDKEYLERVLNVPYEKMKEALKLPSKVSSIDTKISDSEKELNEFVIDREECYDPHRETTHNMLRETIDKLLASLSDRESKIITMRYGLGRTTPMTLDMIGKQLGMTRERIRQIQSSALKKMRDIDVCRELKIFLSY